MFMEIVYEDQFVKLIKGDSLKVMAELLEQSVDMIFTDPPYGHNNNNGDLNARLNNYRERDNKAIKNDSMEAMREVVGGVLDHAARVLRRDCCCCCCCGGGGPRPTFAWLANRMDEGGLSFFHSVIWDKINLGLGWRYRRQYEMVMVGHRKGGKLSWNPDAPAVSNVWRGMKPRSGNHPNEKPLELCKHFIRNHTVKGDVVLDPFCGSGTTLIAARDLGRKAVGIELDSKWCEVALSKLLEGGVQSEWVM